MSAVRRPGLFALAAGLLLACGAAGDGAPQNGLLITIDTTRQDALGCYGGPPGVTPALDALAAESVLYTQARAVAPLTLPSHASILTGLYPPRHTVRDNALGKVPEEARTLAELARARGFRTGAVVAAVVLDAAYGLDQGFDSYDGPERGSVRPGERFYGERPADEVVDAALAWLDARDPERPFFLWVHLFDPHAPYDPPPEHRAAAGGDPYLGEVAFADAEVGRLLERLRAEGLLDETLVVATSDHGEGLGEHGEDTHSAMVYEPMIRVPLLVRHPDGHRAGERSDAPVSVADVFPTFVEALGLGAAGDVDGRSLHRRAVAPERAVYFESYYGHVYFAWSQVAGVADARMKYVHSSRPELYDVRADPAESRDLLDAGGADPAPYRRALSELASRPRLAPAEDAVDASILPDLAALGYAASATAVSAVPDPLDASGPSPHERAGELRDVIAGWTLAELGRVEDALERWDRVLAVNPDNHDVLWRKGRLLADEGRRAEALVPLRRFAAIGPDWPEPRVELARCLRATGDPDGAIAALRDAIAAAPEHAPAYALMAELLEERGDAAEATRYRMLLLELRGD